MEALNEQSIDVWFDRHVVNPHTEGDTLQQILTSAIAKCDLIVLMYSSVSRTSSWVAWELLQRADKMRLIVLHDAPLGMVGVFLRSWANYGIYDARDLSGAATARSRVPKLDRLERVPDDILQAVLKADARTDGLWQLAGYRTLI